MQKVVIFRMEETLQKWLDRGWSVVMLTAAPTALAGSIHNSEKPYFCAILIKQIQN